MGTTSNKLKPPKLVDHISDLPEDVRIHILSLLDTRDAVRTSILSRRWDRMWAHVPEIKFHLIRMDNPKMTSVFETLVSHAAPTISKFDLQLEDCESVTSMMVDLLVRCAATRHVEDLSLDLFGLNCKYILPEHLYYQRSLRELRTISCNFLPMLRVNWESLRVLNVQTGHIEGKIDDFFVGMSFARVIVAVSCPFVRWDSHCSREVQKIAVR